MNREETLALWSRGRRNWNAWAQDLLARRTSMETAGVWKATRGLPENDETRAWFAEAEADFSTSEAPNRFKDPFDCTCFLFPSQVRFDCATFARDASFSAAEFFGPVSFAKAVTESGAQVHFRNARFGSAAQFDRCRFADHVRFDGARFQSWASFVRSRFGGEVIFSDTSFMDDSRFDSAQFDGWAMFESARFYGDAVFGGAIFLQSAQFEGCRFARSAELDRVTFGDDLNFTHCLVAEAALFGQSTFAGRSMFCATTFEGPADFEAVHVERSFSVAAAWFHQIPNFVQAHFKEAPQLDRMIIQRPRQRWGMPLYVSKLLGPGSRPIVRSELLTAADQDAPARWRALKRLAIQGCDQQRALEFHARECRATLFAQTWSLPRPMRRSENLLSAGHALVGLGFWITSDFGRSIVRPLGLWIAITLAAATVYLAEHHALGKGEQLSISSVLLSPVDGELEGATLSPQCLVTDANATEQMPARSSAASQAIYLALRNSLVVLSENDRVSNETYACLYGTRASGADVIAAIPNTVAYTSIIQKLLAAICLVLLAIGISNRGLVMRS